MTKKELSKIIYEFKKEKYDSFDLFYNETSRGVYIFVYSILKNRLKTEEVLQKTYINFIQTVDRLHKNTNVRYALIKIAGSFVDAIYNKEKKNSNENNIIEDENKEDLFFLLDSIEETSNKIVILHLFNKMNFREISDLMDMPIRKVLSLYKKAIRNLKKEVGNKRIKEMMNLLSTEVKVNEINNKFLDYLPKRPMSPEKIRPARIIFPIVLCGLLSLLLIGLMFLSINKPIFGNPNKGEVSDTKKIITYQVLGTLSLFDEVSETTTHNNDQIIDEVDDYVRLVDYYLHKDTLIIESLDSDDMKYNYKYLIKLNTEIYFYFNEDVDGAYKDIDLVSSVIEGYVLINNVKYKVTCTKEVIGRQIKTKVRTYYSDCNFVEVEQDIQKNVMSFSCYKNENVIRKIKLEMIDNGLSISSDKKSFNFSLENNKISCIVNIPDVYEGKIVISTENGEYAYNLAN